MAQSASSSFDPYAWRNFYFEVDREEATRLLCEHPDSTLGTFLIRDSTSPGSYALSVREELVGEQQVRHYLIEPVEDDDGGTSVKIAEQHFVDIPALLNHFKMRILANVSLVRPLQKPTLEKMIALYSFEGEQSTDLPFEKNELLEVIGKPQEGWWQARNALGNTGLVPTNYLARLEDVIVERGSPDTSSLSSENRLSNVSATSEGNESVPCSSPQSGRVPSWARVMLDRRPNVYDTEALRLKKGELIKVTKVHPSGICEGILNGKKGTFPFTYVELISDEDTTTPTAH
uniref:Cell death abnormality protein 2 n=1 Tax=Ascaris suum TaxID=6253 RepID=F1L381_ASCSU